MGFFINLCMQYKNNHETKAIPVDNRTNTKKKKN